MPGLLTSYMTDRKLDSFSDLFRFLSFIQDREGSKQFLDDQVYYLVTFPVIDFTRYLGLNERSHYQRNKILEILQSLQTLKPILDNFDDIYFRSSVMFPYVKVQKKRSSMDSVGEQLYFYKYPFQFTNYFNTTSLKKQFRVEEFLNQFNISNSKQTELKQIIITALDEAINYRLIKAQFKILTRDNSVRKLTKITKSKVIYLYEIFNSKQLFSTAKNV